MSNGNSQKLQLETGLKQRLSLQHLRFVRMLELNAPELEEAVQKELDENPALEAEDEAPALPSEQRREEQRLAYSVPFRRSEEDRDDFLAVDDRNSIYDELNRQIDQKTLPEDVAEMAHFIIGNLDSNGYLRRDLSKLVDDYTFGMDREVSLEDARRALEEVRGLEPYGIGAVSLQDALLMQLRRMPESQVRDDAVAILSDHFEAFTMKHTHRIISGTKFGAERVDKALELILTLNPKPGAGLGQGGGEQSAAVVPDFTVSRDEYGRLTVGLNNSIPELRIEESFAQAVRDMEQNAATRRERKGKEFVMSRYYDARDFIRVLRQRQQTLYSVMTAIVNLQRDYFESDDVHRLRPMMIKDISAMTGYDISVISRATSGKYVATDAGIFPLRFFFSDTIGDEGEGFTNRELEAVIRKIVDGEQKRHPLSDEKIRELLEEQGYSVSRRTVAKYRDRLDIPVARLRKDL